MDPLEIQGFERDARAVFLEVFKALSWRAFLVGSLLLICIHFIATTIHNWIHHVLHWPEGIVAGVLGVILVVLFFIIKTNPPRFEIELVEAKHRSCEVLVLPLSKPGEEGKQLVDEIISSKEQRSIVDREFLQAFGSYPWRVPLESIAAQVGRPSPTLKSVVVISSTITKQYQESFKTLVEKICPLQLKVIQITSLGTDFQDGVDFLSPGSLSAALVAINNYLTSRKISDGEVMFDVTSGTALVSVLCTAAAFRKGRRIQYVLGIPGGNYEIKVWEPVYLGPGTRQKP